MPSRHHKTAHFLKAKLFHKLDSFADLEERITALPTGKERGDAFEVFAEAYLATQRTSQAKEVWPYDSIPLSIKERLALPDKDMGVDGVFETVAGDFNAFQSKFRSGRPSLTWHELSTFFGLSDQVTQRVLFTNCDDLPSVVNERTGFYCIRGNDLDRLEPHDFAAIQQWLEAGVVVAQRKNPLPHQTEALSDILDALQSYDRATAIMACGTGKTLVALWAAEQLGCDTVLVLVPSLALVRQTLHEWLTETSWSRLAYLCVCSDPSVEKRGDELIVRQSDLDFPISTDRDTVRSFLSTKFAGTKVVFSTYQSAQVVAEAMKGHPPFDLGLFDEAHKTAGREGAKFGLALDNQNLPINKRLFLTATPRHYDVRKKDKEGDTKLVFSMDVPEVYGERAHSLTFAKAARQHIICNYKVIISVVTSEMVTEELLKRGEVLVNGDPIKARQVANQIALQEAVEKYGLSRAFTFHRSVESAKSFVAAGGEGIRAHLPNFKAFHVNGAMPTAKREAFLKDFERSDQAVISNARCLTEGVDVPAVDLVAFMSSKRSHVDIVQATGRAMRIDRNNPDKTTGYILVQLFLEQEAGESVEEAVARSEFEEIWNVLQAMQEQDTERADVIRAMRDVRGRTRGYDDSRLRERIEVLGPEILLQTLRESITAICVDRLGVTWDERFGQLLAYRDRFRHCNVPNTWVENPQLAKWVEHQRRFRKRDELSEDRVRRLKEIGFVWDANVAAFEENFLALVEYKEAHGHCNVPAIHTDNPKLGAFVRAMRHRYKRWKECKEIGEEFGNEAEWMARFSRLEKLGFQFELAAELESEWKAQWNRMYSLLVEHVRKHGHFHVTQEENLKLANWMINQRAKRERLSNEKFELLDAIDFPWNTRDARWEKSFAEWRNWKSSISEPETVHLRKPRTVTRWESRQREIFRELQKDQKRLEREQRMLAAGFDFEPKWERS